MPIHMGRAGLPLSGPSQSTAIHAKRARTTDPRQSQATGINGFNLAYVVAHETFADIVEFVVPELQRRGRYPTAYRDGPLRRKLFGRDRVETTHPAARYRSAAGAA